MDESSEVDWRQHHTSLGEQLWYMYQFGIETDLEIYLCEGQIKRLYNCHKLIFLRLSRNFQTLIQDNNKVEGEDLCISVSSVNSAAFEIILRYAYTDRLELTSLTHAMQIKEFCSDYSMPGLKALCEDFISTFEPTIDNIWEIMDIANKGKKLNAKIKSILGKSTLECIQSPKFVSCSLPSLQRLLSMETLAIDSELQLVQAAMHWARVQNGGVDLDPQSSKKLLGPCLKQLRFLTLTPTEFSVHVANSGLFSSDDTLKILIKLTAPNCEMELPEGICTLTAHRKGVGVPAAELEKVSNQPAELKIAKHPEIEEEADKQLAKKTPIFCYRGSHPSLDGINKKVQSPANFKVVEFKVNKQVFLTGIRIVTRLKQDSSETYDEYLHVYVRQVGEKKKMVAHHTFIAPVSYGPGFFDVMFSKPGALAAGELYEMDINFKSKGVYLSKQRSQIVCVEDYTFNFSADRERFPYSGILQSLLLHS